jgi:YHS domain-containing protein
MKRLPASRLFDPICGMWLEADEVVATYLYIGRTYAFCSMECRDLFARAPDRHVVRLAHAPEDHIAHCCPNQRHPDASQAASSDAMITDIARRPYEGD